MRHKGNADIALYSLVLIFRKIQNFISPFKMENLELAMAESDGSNRHKKKVRKFIK